MHLLEPSDSSYLPFGQSSQVDAPKVELNFPAAQSEHVATLTAPGAPLYFPAVQEVQVDSLEAPTEELDFPAAQSEQVDAPVDELNFPTAQTEQEISPSLLNFPAEQGPSQSELEAPSVGL